MSGSQTEDQAEQTADAALPGRSLWLTVAVGAAVVAAIIAAAIALAGRDAPVLPADAQPLPGETVVPLQDRPHPDERRPLPDIVLDGFGEGAPPVDLAAFRGQPLVVNLWASWCGPCIEEMPDFQRVASEMEGRLTVLGVNVRDAPAQAQRFAEDLGITYPLAVDRDRQLELGAEVFGLPTTLLVDADGMIVLHRTGPLDAEQLRALIAERLGVEAASNP